MIVDWTLVAPLVAAIAGVRAILRSHRQYRADQIERRHHLVNMGGAFGAFWGSLIFGVGHPVMAGLFTVLFAPVGLLPERQYARFELWFEQHVLTRKERQRAAAFRERQARERDAEREFEERLRHPEIAPGSTQRNDP